MDGRSPDPELTTTGHRQAETLWQHLSHPHAEPRQHPFLQAEEVHFGLTHVYCSLMTRSILTAGYIAEACDMALHALPDIFEKYGIYDIDDDGNDYDGIRRLDVQVAWKLSAVSGVPDSEDWARAVKLSSYVRVY